jgi:hypothetical protein
LTCSACCRVVQQTTMSSAYAEVRVMPTWLVDALASGPFAVPESA